MEVLFVESRTGDTVMRETDWDMPPPHEGDVLELHLGEARRWIVEEVDWVFDEPAEYQRSDVAVKTLKVMICREEQFVGRTEEGGHRVSDPICECGHTKSMHAPSRCLGNASTCQCHGFTAKS